MTGMSGSLERKRLLFVVNNDFFFLSHRLRLAQEAQRQGWDVTVAACDNGRADDIAAEGFEYRNLPRLPRLLRIFQPLVTFLAIAAAIVGSRAEVVHLVTIRPIILGGILCKLLRKRFVCALSGLGYAFTDANRATFRRSVAMASYRFIFTAAKCRVIVQNRDDYRFLVQDLGTDAEQVEIIRGVGVDPAAFPVADAGREPATVLFAARLLWDKGLAEFVQAAAAIKRSHSAVRFVVAGDIDWRNPASADVPTVQRWVDEGTIEWLGHVDDVMPLLADAQIVVLPSYREGLPKILLEAGAAALPVVTTDVPGCREVVRNRVNGLLVEVRSCDALAGAISELLDAPELRRRYGNAAREIIQREFHADAINQSVLQVYADLMNDPERPPQAEGVAIRA